MIISTTSILTSGSIDPQCTCDGAGVNPALAFADVPESVKSLAIIVEDPDSPGANFTHWLLYDIAPSVRQIAEGQMPTIGTSGANDFGGIGYGGPCPHDGEHRYVFTLYALDATLGLPVGATKAQLRKAMTGHVIDSAELTTTYQRKNTL